MLHVFVSVANVCFFSKTLLHRIEYGSLVVAGFAGVQGVVYQEAWSVYCSRPQAITIV